jgi:hypothetical protein
MKFLLGILIAAYGAVGCAADWRAASREPTGLAPDPASTPEAVIQVYGARTFGWKGAFGVHTWVAVKPSKAKSWKVYEVIGWRLRWSDSALVVSDRDPDARWYGSEPELYADKRGEGVDALIERIDKAAAEYPYASEYGLWPGPNSNTFTAWLTRAVPELEVDLPGTAIGKDYFRDKLIDSPASGHGMQLSFAGLLGVTASSIEGFEVNVLGLSFGLGQSGLKLPFIGRIGSGPRFDAPRINGAGDKP